MQTREELYDYLATTSMRKNSISSLLGREEAVGATLRSGMHAYLRRGDTGHPPIRGDGPLLQTREVGAPHSYSFSKVVKADVAEVSQPASLSTLLTPQSDLVHEVLIVPEEPFVVDVPFFQCPIVSILSANRCRLAGLFSRPASTSAR